MSANEVPVQVYEGELQDAAFLVSLLESAGIATNLVGPFRPGQAAIYVYARDAAAARNLVGDFELRCAAGHDTDESKDE